MEKVSGNLSNYDAERIDVLSDQGTAAEMVGTFMEAAIEESVNVAEANGILEDISGVTFHTVGGGAGYAADKLVAYISFGDFVVVIMHTPSYRA